MSKAVKCNRCGECFDPEYAVGDYTNITEIKYLDKEHYREYQYGEFQMLDLCPACTVAFRKFMEGTPMVEESLLDSLREDYNDQCVEVANLQDEVNELREDYNKLYADYEDYNKLYADYDDQRDLNRRLTNKNRELLDALKHCKEKQLEVLGDIPAEDMKRFILDAMERATFGGCCRKARTMDDYLGKRCCK